jgi:hypothetical protein
MFKKEVMTENKCAQTIFEALELRIFGYPDIGILFGTGFIINGIIGGLLARALRVEI